MPLSHCQLEADENKLPFVLLLIVSEEVIYKVLHLRGISATA